MPSNDEQNSFILTRDTLECILKPATLYWNSFLVIAWHVLRFRCTKRLNLGIGSLRRR